MHRISLNPTSSLHRWQRCPVTTVLIKQHVLIVFPLLELQKHEHMGNDGGGHLHRAIEEQKNDHSYDTRSSRMYVCVSHIEQHRIIDGKEIVGRDVLGLLHVLQFQQQHLQLYVE